METFVPLGDPNLMYEMDLRVNEPAQVEMQVKNSVNETGMVTGEQLEEEKRHSEPLTDDSKRQRYLQRLLNLEKRMKKEENVLQLQIEMMKQILELKNPMEQLSAYLALKQEFQQENEEEVVEDLMSCAKHLTNEEDSEVAMLGAFFYLKDRQRHVNMRGMGMMMHVVAAMIGRSTQVDVPPAMKT
ncbi:uncharacterized protein PHALS_10329 [Plasmopara halstedii]|uniref:Uncharacterized protein n=1 Tax=Plasmopara halstedii TaxID=4781 RepID=A0A0P1AHX4_PLAHL|nr:uncharacterized protein PHALS_10329 [Plasmopara halstedii]CEG40111.1 hypothetical protein PHALS_10329 [Plasmopara halstedii]|eukprot:XP_024576480.1 hypothetical protein PHALS_10329 [Plasmopara halstedii]